MTLYTQQNGFYSGYDKVASVNRLAKAAFVCVYVCMYVILRLFQIIKQGNKLL